MIPQLPHQRGGDPVHTQGVESSEFRECLDAAAGPRGASVEERTPARVLAAVVVRADGEPRDVTASSQRGRRTRGPRRWS